ncbi:helix-turn-helix domain-containing protein [Salinifilum aidingensis]
MAEDQAGGWEFVTSGRLPPEAVVSAVGYRSALEQPALHRGLPSPGLTLVLTFDTPVVSGTGPEQAFGPQAHSADALLGGLRTSPAYLAQPAVQTGVQLAVRPLAARALFGLPAGELREHAVHAHEVLGREVELLRERVGELPTWGERFAVLDEYLRRRLAQAPRRAPRAEVVEAWTWLAGHRGAGSIAALARHVHLSERQLTAVFRAELGLAPKAVARLMRFEDARQRISRSVRQQHPLDLAAAAHRCGYADHSHLVRDFRQYTGASPTRWVAEEFRNIQAGAGQRGEEFGYDHH